MLGRDGRAYVGGPREPGRDRARRSGSLRAARCPGPESVTFEAFALPPGVAPPASTAGSAGECVEEGEKPLRCVSATPEWIDGLAGVLERAGGSLAERDALEIALTLGRVGERFLDPSDPVRLEALELLPPTAGLSPQMALAVLDGMAFDWTGPRLAGLLEAELGDASALDRFVELGGRRTMAVGPSLCVQVSSGNVPGVGVSALLRSLLAKGPTLLKPGLGDVALPVLFARALGEADRALAAAAAVVYWPGGSHAAEDAALSHADVVTAYGSDRAVRELRARTPVTARFVAYHHRVSVAVVGLEALSPQAIQGAAAEVARSVAVFDQRGCVSPQLVYVEEGGEGTPEAFAEALAGALEELESRLPTGRLDTAEAASLQQMRGTAELVAASGSGRVLHGGTAPWTVLFEPSPGPPGASPGRLVRVRPLPALEALTRLLEPLSGHLQTVGVVGLGSRVENLAVSLGRAGASRVVPVSAVPFPPAWWHHDGRGPLLDLLRWVDLESSQQ